MISEPQEEQASLYALGLLDADEARAFEHEIDADSEVRTFVHGMQETISRLALAGDRAELKPPPELRARVLEAVASRSEVASSGGRQVAATLFRWLPWALAALFIGCTAVLTWFQQYQTQKLNFLAAELIRAMSAPTPAADALAQVSFCALEPTPDFKTGQPRAMVLWDAAHRQGKLRVNRLAPPTEGKDYQLWTVEKDRKEPVSAGVFHINPDGTADVPFQPVAGEDGAVVAVAVSLEQAGGSPTAKGPILLLGKF